MKASFWRTVESIGAAGSALCDWKHYLGSDFDSCKPLLKLTGRSPRYVTDPVHPPRRLALYVDGEEDFVAVDDDFAMDPIPFKAADVVEMQPQWEPIAKSLAEVLGFDYGAWENHGHLRHIGSSQDTFGRISPVLLFMPPGNLGDLHCLFRDLAATTEATILFPTNRWFNLEIEALRMRNRLEFVSLFDRFTRIESQPVATGPLPTVTRPAGPERETRAVIHAANGLNWSQVTIVISGNQTIRIIAPGQEGSHLFAKRQKMGREHPLGILMTLIAKGEWRNPPRSSSDYQRSCKAFQRLTSLLRALVPLSERPFRRSTNAWVPLFHVIIHQDLMEQR